MPDRKKVFSPESIDDMYYGSERELQALRDENDSLRQECQELRAEKKFHDDFITEVAELLSPSYDVDEAIESIIIKFVKDMQSLGQIIAKLTADYR